MVLWCDYRFVTTGLPLACITDARTDEKNNGLNAHGVISQMTLKYQTPANDKIRNFLDATDAHWCSCAMACGIVRTSFLFSSHSNTSQ
jgi:hypothetical protein